MTMTKTCMCLLLFFTAVTSAAIQGGFYADITDGLMVPPHSAAKAGSDLSTGNGISVESTPGNLPFDSLNRISLSYAGFYGNTFNTSLVTYRGSPAENIGIGVLLGYVYIPDIPNTTKSDTTPDGEMREAKISYFSASRIIMRAGVGRAFTIRPDITLGAGIALNAKRVRLPETGYGIGMDAGARLLLSKPGISLAVQLENITSSYTYWSADFKEHAYPHCRAGIGYERYFPYIYGSLQLSYATPDLFANDGINSITTKKTENDNTIETIGHYELYDKPSLLFSSGRYGVEYTIMNAVSFRAGVYSGSISFGAGFHLLRDKAAIDVAYITHALSGTYQLSLNYAW